MDLSLVFWISVAVLGWTWAGYPIVAWALARLRPRPVRAWLGPPRPVTALVVARDEERWIGEKIDSLRAGGIPADKLEILVVDDGSRDRTAEVARQRGAMVVSLPRSSGKAAALNAGAAAASHDLLVLTDARQPVDPGALRALTAPFADESVGAVTGELDGAARGAGGIFRRYDDALRRWEARTASAVGVTGALWAIRRGLFPRLPDGLLLDDLYAPMYVVVAGFRVVVEPEARARERETATAPARERRRRVRTLAGNFQLAARAPWLLVPIVNPICWRFWSHKMLRLAGPAALLAIVSAVLALAPTGAFWAALAGGGAVCFVLAALGAHAGRLGSLVRGFVGAQVLVARAWAWAIMGGRRDLWRPEPRADLSSAGASHGMV